MTDAGQGSTPTVMMKLFLSSDHVTAATGKTLAITISKAGGAFANPAAGATNATEVSSGWYKVTLGAGDTGTVGDLVVRGTAGSCDDSERLIGVRNANNGGMAALPDTAVTTNASLLTSGTGTDQLSVSAGKVLLQATQAGVTIPTVTTVATVTALAATALDAITATVPNGVATTFPGRLMQLWARFFYRVARSSTTITTYRSDGSTGNTTQTYTSAANTDDVGAAS